MSEPAAMLIIFSTMLLTLLCTIKPEVLPGSLKIRIPVLPAIIIGLSFFVAILDEFSGVEEKVTCDIVTAALSLVMLHRGMENRDFISLLILEIISLIVSILFLFTENGHELAGTFSILAIIYCMAILANHTKRRKKCNPEYGCRIGITEIFSDCIYLILCFGLMGFSTTTFRLQALEPVFGIGLTISSCIIFVLSLIRFASAEPFVVIHKFARKITAPYIDLLSERKLDYDQKLIVYEAVFKRVQQYFEDKMPFLDDNFTLVKLAEQVFTNKVYVSKAISEYSGMNFCQFVNTYRIRYSIECMRRNPKLKISELAYMSGFKTQASFNSAFRRYTGEAPSDWARRNFKKIGAAASPDAEAVLQN